MKFVGFGSSVVLLALVQACAGGVHHPQRTVDSAEIPVAIAGATASEGYTLLVARTEVTQRDYRRLTGDEPSWHSDCPDCPVERVSWYDAAAYANARSREEGLPLCYRLEECTRREPDEDERFRERRNRELSMGVECAVAISVGPSCTGYRLPTRAESEAFVDRRVLAERPRFVRRRAFFGRTGSQPSTLVVGTLAPDDRGLHDTLGNVEEWLDDPGTAPSDATGFRRDETRWQGLGGGCLYTTLRTLRRATRTMYPASYVRNCVGFRLVRTQAASQEESGSSGGSL